MSRARASIDSKAGGTHAKRSGRLELVRCLGLALPLIALDAPALGATSATSSGDGVASRVAQWDALASRPFPSAPAAGWVNAFARPNGATINVTHCGDAGPGSLRAAASSVVDGGTIDMSHLSCSTISLSTGQIEIAADNVALLGRGGPLGSALVISGSYGGRVLHHTGTGVLKIVGTSIRDGLVRATNTDGGGCIKSAGNVGLYGSSVSNCYLSTNSGTGYGGGIATISGSVFVADGAVSSNQAFATQGNALGGGVRAAS